MCVVAIWQVSRKKAIGSAGTALVFLTREFLGRKGSAICQAALAFIKAYCFFSQRLRSLRTTVYLGGFVLSYELSV